jgi:two-component system phosphate regulon sensor histidine kinase PhoR
VRSSLRNKLLITFLVLVVVVGAGTLFAIERTLADDLVASLNESMTKQGEAVSRWIDMSRHVDKLAKRLSEVTDARVTIIAPSGLIEGDSVEESTVGRPIGDAHEVARARRGEVGRAIRQLRPDEPPQYLIAVKADAGRVIRLAKPLGAVLETRARMRNRLLIGAGFAFLGCLVLSWIFIRAITRPLQSMTQTAERLAKGDYEVPVPQRAIDSGGELGLLARTMMRMAGEVKAKVADLTEQRDLLEVVFAGLVEGVVVVDRAGKIVLVNDAAKPLLALDRLQPLIDRAVAGEQTDGELEISGRHVRVSGRPLGGDAGSGGAILVLYDVTRMRSLEAVRREFLSNAAHELRTPITSIAGYAETLIGGQVDPETSKEFLQTIHRNAERIAGLVNDLVLLDTLGGRAAAVGERLPVPLAQVIGDAARTARGVTPSAQIEVEVPEKLAVLGTRDGLDHVFQNLIDNAVKYGGDTKVTVTAVQTDARVRVAIADRGKGIPPGHEERIFERFYRIDPGRSRDRGGSGLGLAIVKSQVEAMGGRVWVESNHPGARFIVELETATEARVKVA